MPEYYAFTTGFIESEDELRLFRNEVEPECSRNFAIHQRMGGHANKKQWVCSDIVAVTDGAEGVELSILFQGYSLALPALIVTHHIKWSRLFLIPLVNSHLSTTLALWHWMKPS